MLPNAKPAGYEGVADPNAPAPSHNIVLGARLRRLRMGQGWSVRQLAAYAGIGKNTVVRVEAGQGASASTLGKICQALGIELQQLGPDGAPHVEPCSVHHHEQETWVVHAYEGLSDVRGTARLGLLDASRRRALAEQGAQVFLTFMNCQLAGGRMNAWVLELHGERRPTSHDGEEFVYCLQGEALIRVAGREYRLRTGDAASFWSSEIHSYAPAPGSEGPARILSVWVPASSYDETGSPA